MNRVNIAYVPADQQLGMWCIDYAKGHFATSANGYLLNGTAAFPHVTLVQFDAPDMPGLAFFHEVREVCRRRNITFDRAYFEPGTGQHKGYIWTGLGVRRDRELVDDQRRVLQALRAKNFAIWTGTDDLYFPHLTFARLVGPPAAAAAPWVIDWPGPDLWAPATHRFDLALGLSDLNGVLTKIIFSSR
jgi:hypothetical protein